MKLSSWDKQLVLALPRECAASQSDQTINPSKNEVRNGGGAGCKSPLPHLTEGRGDAFLLDILFHRMSVTAMFQQESPGNPESHCLLAPEDSLARLELSFTFRPVCRLNSAMRCSPAPLPT